MALAINDFDNTEGGARDRLARALGVAAALYGLMAGITGAVAAAGMFGLAGLTADPSAADPARMLGLPWSLASGAAGGDTTSTLLITLGSLVANLVILAVASRLARGKLRA
jgi:disulfide bond formation protein DsbB